MKRKKFFGLSLLFLSLQIYEAIEAIFWQSVSFVHFWRLFSGNMWLYLSFPAKVLSCTFLKDSVKPKLSFLLNGKDIQERSGSKRNRNRLLWKNNKIDNFCKLSSSNIGWTHFFNGKCPKNIIIKFFRQFLRIWKNKTLF